jgi:hypothetical protein
VSLEQQLAAAVPAGGAAAGNCGGEHAHAFPETSASPTSHLDSLPPSPFFSSDSYSPAASALTSAFTPPSEVDTPASEPVNPEALAANPKVAISKAKVSCCYCGAEFDTSHQCRIHKQRYHSDRRVRPLEAVISFACPNGCGANVKDERTLERHLKFHCTLGVVQNSERLTWRCACNKSFPRFDKFKAHKCVGGNATYVCSCKAQFDSRSAFETHHKTHNKKAGRKPKSAKVVGN